MQWGPLDPEVAGAKWSHSTAKARSIWFTVMDRRVKAESNSESDSHGPVALASQSWGPISKIMKDY